LARHFGAKMRAGQADRHTAWETQGGLFRGVGFDIPSASGYRLSHALLFLVRASGQINAYPPERAALPPPACQLTDGRPTCGTAESQEATRDSDNPRAQAPICNLFLWFGSFYE
jgi:hypothetical protein